MSHQVLQLGLQEWVQLLFIYQRLRPAAGPAEPQVRPRLQDPVDSPVLRRPVPEQRSPVENPFWTSEHDQTSRFWSFRRSGDDPPPFRGLQSQGLDSGLYRIRTPSWSGGSRGTLDRKTRPSLCLEGQKLNGDKIMIKTGATRLQNRSGSKTDLLKTRQLLTETRPERAGPEPALSWDYRPGQSSCPQRDYSGPPGGADWTLLQKLVFICLNETEPEPEPSSSILSQLNKLWLHKRLL